MRLTQIINKQINKKNLWILLSFPKSGREREYQNKLTRLFPLSSHHIFPCLEEVAQTNKLYDWVSHSHEIKQTSCLIRKICLLVLINVSMSLEEGVFWGDQSHEALQKTSLISKNRENFKLSLLNSLFLSCKQKGCRLGTLSHRQSSSLCLRDSRSGSL